MLKTMRISLLILLFAAGSLRAQSADDSDRLTLSDKSTLVGKVVAVESDGIQFKMKGSGYVIKIKWASLSEQDQASLKKQAGDVVESEIVIPPYKMDKLTMKNKATHLGHVVKDQSTAEALAIKIPGREKPMLILRSLVDKTEQVNVNRLDYFSPEETFEYMKKSKPPATANDYYYYGRLGVMLQLWDKAIENFERCGRTDPRLKKKCDDKVASVKKMKEQTAKADALWKSAQDAESKKDWKTALKLYTEMSERFPDDHRKATVKKESQRNVRALHLRQQIKHYAVDNEIRLGGWCRLLTLDACTRNNIMCGKV